MKISLTSVLTLNQVVSPFYFTEVCVSLIKKQVGMLGEGVTFPRDVTPWTRAKLIFSVVSIPRQSKACPGTALGAAGAGVNWVGRCWPQAIHWAGKHSPRALSITRLLQSQPPALRGLDHSFLSCCVLLAVALLPADHLRSRGSSPPMGPRAPVFQEKTGLDSCRCFHQISVLRSPSGWLQHITWPSMTSMRPPRCPLVNPCSFPSNRKGCVILREAGDQRGGVV